MLIWHLSYLIPPAHGGCVRGHHDKHAVDDIFECIGATNMDAGRMLGALPKAHLMGAHGLPGHSYISSVINLRLKDF